MTSFNAEPGTPEFFWRRVDKSGGELACWPWTGSKARNGYGTVKYRGQKWYAHRLAFVISAGKAELTPRSVVMHSCDNPPCCNPAHLSLGTHRLNAADMVAKGRATQRGMRGSRNGFAKFKEADVLWIAAQLRSGMTGAQVAKALGVSRHVIHSIRSGRTWGHLTGFAARTGEHQ